MKKTLILSVCSLLTGGILTTQAQDLTAAFGASEARAVYFEEHFEDYQLKPWIVDSTGVGQEWLWFSNDNDDAYKKIGDPNSWGMLFNKEVNNTGNNTFISSPEVTIKPHSRVSFFGFFEVEEIEKFNVTLSVAAGTDTTAVLDLKSWHAAHPDYKGGDFYDHEWAEFTADLSAFSGKAVSFVFRYVSPESGGDVAFDDFTVYQTGTDDVKATIGIGSQVHFENYSTGSNLTYEWTFEGGMPATSTEKDPVVTYNQSGSFGVKLVTYSGGQQVSHEVTDYVKVSYKTPIAKVAFPKAGYRNATNCAVYVPVNTPITFKDTSDNFPQYQLWEFMPDGESVALHSFSGPEATVTFEEEGLYQFTMTAGNEAGENTFASGNQDIVVGGAQFIWNNTKEEKSTTPLFYYADEDPNHGYIGSNDLGITKWAEKFDAPMAKAIISQIRVFFKNNNTYKRNSYATVSIHEVGADGMPGKEISSVMKMVKDFNSSRRYSATYGTAFLFDDEYVILEKGEPFFVVVNDLPAYNNGESEVQMASLVRQNDSDNTAYIYQDGVWKASPTPMSLTGIWPYLHYSGMQFEQATGIGTVQYSTQGAVRYYDLNGRQLPAAPRQGIYLQRTADGQVHKYIAK